MLQTLDFGIGPGTNGAALDLDFAVVLNVNVVIIDFIVFLCFAVVGVQKYLNTIVFVDVVGGEIRHHIGILNAKAKIQIVVIPGRLELALVVADGKISQVFDAVGRCLLPDTLIELAVHRDRSAGFPALCQVGRRGRLLRGQELNLRAGCCRNRLRCRRRLHHRRSRRFRRWRSRDAGRGRGHSWRRDCGRLCRFRRCFGRGRGRVGRSGRRVGRGCFRSCHSRERSFLGQSGQHGKPRCQKSRAKQGTDHAPPPRSRLGMMLFHTYLHSRLPNVS